MAGFTNFLAILIAIILYAIFIKLLLIYFKYTIFSHNNQYFLSISTNKLSQSQKEFFFSTIVEFANFVSNSQTFLAKLEEGTICFLKNNAIKNCIK